MKSKYGTEPGGAPCGFRQKCIAISMLDGRNIIIEFKIPTLYKDDEKLKTLNEMKDGGYVPDTRTKPL